MIELIAPHKYIISRSSLLVIVHYEAVLSEDYDNTMTTTNATLLEDTHRIVSQETLSSRYDDYWDHDIENTYNIDSYNGCICLRLGNQDNFIIAYWA